MSKKDLLHNIVCEKLGITRQELADKLGLSISTINSWSDEKRISKSAKLVMELMLENKELDDTIDKIKDVGHALVKITKEKKAKK
jgi:DNA-binding helix-turn-helix protein